MNRIFDLVKENYEIHPVLGIVSAIMILLFTVGILLLILAAVDYFFPEPKKRRKDQDGVEYEREQATLIDKHYENRQTHR